MYPKIVNSKQIQNSICEHNQLVRYYKYEDYSTRLNINKIEEAIHYSVFSMHHAILFKKYREHSIYWKPSYSFQYITNSEPSIQPLCIHATESLFSCSDYRNLNLWWINYMHYTLVYTSETHMKASEIHMHKPIAS